ncbi:hypothetical protein D5R40_27115 [Okeania hirsuta]|uniref:Uncharacterized protein n=2 Tax=Okeania hirsuta TaxID=1458930 RepID=A0A3N6P1Q9_9CYAN|nr:hypothetical protein [Okeania hirsuta]RQH23304.1 hypothetical protein D4Z78_05935 [Okeania hirsuta]RQH27551.1 hypothetical protein D5R40_27115 [Okeania hirsuta]
MAVILIGGVYMLVADLAKEKRLGTLNFIRLSPQSIQKILLGKLLGVPILIYLALVLGSYWIWKAVNRRYRNPNATIISKEQSYWLMGCFHFYLLPLFLLINIGNDEKSSYIL